jgi:trk system potassium uptake protein TrkH
MTTEFAGNLTKHPARSAVAWYAGGVILGTLALMAPQCHGTGAATNAITWLDAAFTSTSAICVTGLGVRSTGEDFNVVGQSVILLLIQIGGVGIMTVTTYIMFGMDGRIDLRQKMIIAETLGGRHDADLRWVVRSVLLLTLAVEGAGVLILAPWFYFRYDEYTLMESLWYAIFHSISAFCNAGFSLNDDSLMPYVEDPVVNFTIMALIITGGIGFPVLLDLRRNWHGDWLDRWDRLHLHTKLMLIGTTVLVSLGTAMFLVLEWNYELQKFSLWQRPMIALFQSVTCRTAGFNTLEFSKLTNASLFISILLMAIGGGACSTAGGFKVATITVLLAHAWNLLRGRRRLNLFRKTVPIELVQRAIATAMLFFLVAVVALTLLLVIEQAAHTERGLKEAFLDSVFEVVSALGTVGLSTGLTTKLSPPGLMLIMSLMFMGRLGPISMFVALSQSQKQAQLEFLKEEPLIG